MLHGMSRQGLETCLRLTQEQYLLKGPVPGSKSSGGDRARLEIILPCVLGGTALLAACALAVAFHLRRSRGQNAEGHKGPAGDTPSAAVAAGASSGTAAEASAACSGPISTNHRPPPTAGSAQNDSICTDLATTSTPFKTGSLPLNSTFDNAGGGGSGRTDGRGLLEQQQQQQPGQVGPASGGSGVLGTACAAAGGIGAAAPAHRLSHQQTTPAVLHMPDVPSHGPNSLQQALVSAAETCLWQDTPDLLAPAAAAVLKAGGGSMSLEAALQLKTAASSASASASNPSPSWQGTPREGQSQQGQHNSPLHFLLSSGNRSSSLQAAQSKSMNASMANAIGLSSRGAIDPPSPPQNLPFRHDLQLGTDVVLLDVAELQQLDCLAQAQPQAQPQAEEGQSLERGQDASVGIILYTSRQQAQVAAAPPTTHAEVIAAPGGGDNRAAGGILGIGQVSSVVPALYEGCLVAVKLLHPSMVVGQRLADFGAASLAQEVDVLGRCSHKNVVRLLGSGLLPPQPFLVMEHMPMTLHSLIYDSDQPLPLDKVLRIATDIACGLAYLHPTILHRDLKPRNVLLDGPEAGVVKLCDFGLSRITQDTLVTDHPETGTPAYMAPECFDGANYKISPAIDVFALAVVVTEMLSRTVPWSDLSALQIAVAVTLGEKRVQPPTDETVCPRPLRKLITECMDIDPKQRPSAAEVAKRLAIMQRQLMQGTRLDANVSTKLPSNVSEEGGLQLALAELDLGSIDEAKGGQQTDASSSRQSVFTNEQSGTTRGGLRALLDAPPSQQSFTL